MPSVTRQVNHFDCLRLALEKSWGRASLLLSMTGAGKVVGEEEGKGVAATREEELAQKHIKEMVALASGKAEK